MLRKVNLVKVKLSKKKAHQTYKLADGTYVPGGSTIAKVGEDNSFLINWAWKMGIEGKDYKKVTDEAADIGSVAHFMITCHFKNDDADFSDFSQVAIDGGEKIFDKFLNTWAEEEYTYVGNEVELVSEYHKYGGTLDLIARDRKGRLILIDEKSSPRIYPSFYRQVAAYRNLWDENNLEKIHKCVIFRHGKVNPNDTEIRPLPADTSKHFNVFLKQLALYYAFKELND